jgi:ketosteroid isomerase-like protein
MIRFIISIFTLAILAACNNKKGTSNTETKLLELNKQYDSALIKQDLEALNRFYSEDFVSTTPEGKVLNKLEQIASIKASEVKLEQGQSSLVKVKVYGNAAVMTGNFIAKGNYRGNPVSINERYTMMWVKTDTSWQITAEQSNVIVK